MVYQFLENKEKHDLDQLNKETLIDAYLYLQEVYNILEDDFALTAIERL
jgi:hypothetical protein